MKAKVLTALVVALLLTRLLPIWQPVWAAAIAADATGQASETVSNVSSGRTLSLNNTAGDGMVCAVRLTTDTITDVTYNAISLLPADSKINVYTTVYISLYHLVAPATGTHNITLTISNTGTPNVQWGCATYTGTKQTGQPDAATAAGYSSPNEATTNVPLTTVADNSWMFAACGDDNDNTVTASTNAFARLSISTLFKLFDTNAAQTPAGAKTLTVTHSSNSLKCGVLSLAPAAAAGGATARRGLLLGIGN